jgi:hypothetical protein
MTTISLWLVFIIFTILTVGLAFPEETTEICIKLRRYLHQRYARRNGQEAADKFIPLRPWERRPWE